MKKFIISLVVLFMLMVSVPLTAEAHNSCSLRRSSRRTSYARSYRTVNNYRTVSPNYRVAGYTYNRPSFYRRHRNLINVGIATGAGALIGGLARGKRGAGWGALLGAGGGALYTYVLNKKKRRY